MIGAAGRKGFFIFFAVIMFFAVAASAQEIPERRAIDETPWQFDDLYQIGSYDRLEINVWGVEGLHATVEIRPDGRFHFPFLGDVYARGKTVVDLAKEMDLALKDFVFEPQTTINLIRFQAPSVQVQGAAPNPGKYNLYPNDSVMDVLASSGNLDEAVYAKGIKLFRDGAVISVKSNPLLPADRGFSYKAKPGDVLMVPEDPKISVFISGEVPNPGLYEVAPGETAWRLIERAGGIGKDGSKGRAELLRNYPGANSEVIALGGILGVGAGGSDVPLQDGDIIDIPTSSKAKRNAMWRKVLPMIRDAAIVYNVLQNN